MAKYDPRRPKQITNDDEPAQVDALLDLREGGSISAGSSASVSGAHAPVEVVSVVETVTDDAVVGSVIDAPTERAADALTGTATDGLSKTVLEETHLGPDPLVGSVASGSDVPVAPPPQEGTVNRAILGAVVTAALAAVIAFLVLRRRRST